MVPCAGATLGTIDLSRNDHLHMPSQLEILNSALRVDAPRISFADFRELLTPYSSTSLVRTCVEVAWRAWSGEHSTWLANETGLGFVPLLVPLAVVCASGQREATPADLGDLFYRYCGVQQSSAEAKAFADGVARAAIGSDAAFLVPDLTTAKRVERLFSIARVMTASWLPSRIRVDEFLRALWLAERLRERWVDLERVNRVLGMELDVFIRASLVLFAAAMAAAPTGRIPIDLIGNRPLTRYSIDRAVLELAASRLSTNAEDIESWISRIYEFAPPGMVQHSPSVLVSTPLLKVPWADAHEYLCPSPVHLMAAVRDRVRHALSSEAGTTNQVMTLYGDLLEEYVAFVARAHDAVVLRVDDIDPGVERHADLILIEENAGLIVEVKRSIGVSFGARGLTRPMDVIAVLEHLLGAYGQCLATYRRRRWEREGFRPSCLAGVVLIDESIAAEGAAFAELYARQGGADLPYDVMGISEFEEALGVLGVRRLVSMISSRAENGMHGAPLAQYAMQHLRLPTREVAEGRGYLRAVAAQLGQDLESFEGFFTAKWP